MVAVFGGENQHLDVSEQKRERETDVFIQCYVYSNAVVLIVAFFTEVEIKVAKMVMQN